MRLNLWWCCREKEEGVHTACISGIIRLIHYAIVGYQTQFRYNTDTVASPSISSSKSYKSCFSSASFLATSPLISPFSRFWRIHPKSLCCALNFLLPQPILFQQRANTEPSSKNPPKFFWICYGYFLSVWAFFPRCWPYSTKFYPHRDGWPAWISIVSSDRYNLLLSIRISTLFF